MKNTYGKSISVTLFGESHGDCIGAVIDGLAPGIEINTEYIESELDKRRPHGKISTQRKERDSFRIVSGMFEKRSTGTPLCIIIDNENKNSGDYSSIKDTPRPSHADYTAYCKYHGYSDYRGGGHFSGRITAALVAAGAVISYALKGLGIEIGTHISSLHGVCDTPFESENVKYAISALYNKSFPTISDEAGELMKAEIMAAMNEGDSVGGTLESAVVGIPAGIGEPWFDTVEGELAHILFSIPAVKGVEFGLGFGFDRLLGSEANDPFRLHDGSVVTSTNHNGGINGGITNGMPIVLRTVVKPTPSIFKVQDTVNLKTNTNEKLQIQGRHDPAIIHRAAAVQNACIAIALADLLAVRYGTDYLNPGLKGQK